MKPRTKCLSYFNELDEELEEGRVSLEKLEKRVTQLEAGLDPELRTKGLLEKNLYKLTNRVSEIEVELEKTELLEERVATLKTENAELRIHLNLVVDAVNNITRAWNEACSNNEQVDQAIDNDRLDEVKAVDDDDDDDEPTMEDNEPPQLTLQQVYNMYQSQPPDEEDWQEMTKAIKVAEGYEARLQKQEELPTRVNGLTQDEWNDLLRI